MFSFNQKTYLLLAVIILSIIFFICGILHLLIKHFLKPANSESEEIASATAFQGQLQQLFHLHDEGVDQSFIDSLPIFLYKSIIGIKDPFDCVVCLCEFGPGDKLRLLPNCSHAFHIGCIDTWLLSHSTCPLCRRSLLPEYSSDGSSRSSLNVEDDSRHEAGAKDESNFKESDLKLSLQHVKLGKFRNVGVGEEGSSSRGGGEIKERCFSMGAIEYVMNESTVLQVAITPPPSKRRTNRINEGESGRISDRCNRESFSASKIRPESRREKGVYDDCSRRAFSFRLPKHVGDLGLDLEAAGRRRQKSKLVSHGPGCVV